LPEMISAQHPTGQGFSVMCDVRLQGHPMSCGLSPPQAEYS
jgi:hypothetical protein